jgi:hypothetical protein
VAVHKTSAFSKKQKGEIKNEGEKPCSYLYQNSRVN